MDNLPEMEELPNLGISTAWKIYTVEDLDSERAFEALAVYPAGGMILQPIARSSGNEVGSKNEWMQVGWEKEMTSSEIFGAFVSDGVPYFQAWVFEYLSFGH